MGALAVAGWLLFRHAHELLPGPGSTSSQGAADPMDFIGDSGTAATDPSQSSQALAAPRAPSAASAQGLLQPDAVSDAAESVLPSVVNVFTTKLVASSWSGDPLLDYLMGRRRPMRAETSLGSGVIVSDDGLVLTNNHVVEQAAEVRVRLNDGREMPARILGADPATDLAVLRLQGSSDGFVPARLGDSDALRLGEFVIAVGNPFGLSGSVTLGIVSAVGRGGVGILPYEDFIQTDAAINPGNSGGALVNLRGELVGINTAILSRSGGSQGIGFSIPVNVARPIMESLLATGRVERGWLGVGLGELSPSLARRLGVDPGLRGVVVTAVGEGSPAAQAGVEPGDVIVSMGGKPVDSRSRLKTLIALQGPGRHISLDLQRGGDRRTLDATLSVPPDQPIPAQSGSEPGSRPFPR
jgi:Do/DeqQ family serine protease